ncbi:MAG: twin-arginine translocase TatA/TatE family subunit [Thermodesulfobacteriota bacterium]
MWEVGMILLVALIALGPKQLLEVAKTLGKVYGDLQRMISDVRSSVDLESLTSQSTHYPAAYQDRPANPSPPAAEDMVSPSKGEKSGPDFYADLLAASEEKPDSPEHSAEADTPREVPAAGMDAAATDTALKDPSSGPTPGRTDRPS